MNRIKTLYRILLAAGCILAGSGIAIPQEAGDILLQQKLEELSESDTRGTDFQEMADYIMDLENHPVNLNGASSADLKKIPFLTDAQVRSLLDYIRRYGEMLSAYELSAVDGFDSLTIARISPYLSVGADQQKHPVKLYNLLGEGRHQVLFRYQRVLQKQQGYGISDSMLEAKPSSGYMGSPDRYLFRYRYSFYDRIRIGIAGDKDPGEEFFRGSQKHGMDFYGGYLSVDNTGILKTLVIGDFHAEFGQGLTLGTGTSFGSLLSSGNYLRSERGITPVLTSDENRFMRGIAGTLRTRHLSFSAFFSYHRRDGNIVTSAIGERTVSSLGTSGYHRNPSELEDKGRVKEMITGMNLNFRNSFLKAGITVFRSSWDATIRKTGYTYNLFSFAGKDNVNAGADFLAILKDHYLFGEISLSKNGGMAGLAGLAWAPGTRFSFSVIYRNYGRSYQDLLSNAIGQNSDNRNERGILFNAAFKPFRKLAVSGYLDMYACPWLKYLKDLVTRGSEFLLLSDYTITASFRVLFRCRVKSGQANETGSGAVTKWIHISSRSFRLDLEWHALPQLSLKNRAEMMRGKSETGGINDGFYISQDLIYRPLTDKLQVALRYAVFDTHSYDERIYAYENDLAGSFSVPAFEGKGIRCYLLADWTVSRWLRAGIRYAQTFYEDRNMIGSGLNSISGNMQSEIKVQMQVRF